MGITNAITSPGQLSQSHNQKFYLALTLQEQEQQDGQPSHRGAIQISPASHMGVYPTCNLLPPGSNLAGQAKTQPRADFGYSTHPHRLPGTLYALYIVFRAKKVVEEGLKINP